MFSSEDCKDKSSSATEDTSGVYTWLQQDPLLSKGSSTNYELKSKAPPMKTTIIESQKTIKRDKVTGKRYKIREKTTKQYKTVLTGNKINTTNFHPQKCSIDCLTRVHAKDRVQKKCVCKLHKNYEDSEETHSTQTETHTYYMTKACSGCFKMKNCGTQYIDMTKDQIQKEIRLPNQDLNDGNNQLETINILMVTEDELNQNYNRKPYQPGYHIPQNIELNNDAMTNVRANKENINVISAYKWELSEFSRQNHNNACNESHLHKNCKRRNYMGARAWALSKYITRGPDF